MSINIDQWCARIGSLIQEIGTVRTGSTRYYKYLNIISYKIILLYTFFDSWWHWSQNPGLTKKKKKKKKTCYYSCCHWNVNSILAYDKISLLTTYNIAQKFAIICISETYLDSTADGKTI